MSIEVVEAANQIAVQRIIQSYLDPEQEGHAWIIEGSRVTCRRIWSRYGIPADAACWRYVFEHPQGWSFAARSTWRAGRLHEPVAVHTVIEDYFLDNIALIPDVAAAAVAVNEWVQGVPL